MADLLPSSNRSVVWAGVRKLEIRQPHIRVPNDDEVLVEVITTGICGSDCHNWDSANVSRELILGHESAGLIKTIGKNVTDRFVGQRVAIEPGFSCKECEFCGRGKQNICSRLKYCGMDPTDGTLSQYFTCRASNTVPIPEDVSWEEAGSIQPLAIAVQVARRASLNPSQSLAIFGCGPLGLLILAVAKAYGVKKIVMFDIEESRTKFAESYGADVGIVTPRHSDPSQDVLSFSQHYAREVITKYGLGYGFDVAIEASGAEICATMAICMLKAGGTCIQAGLGRPMASLPLFLITANELDVKGTVRYTHGCFEDAISLLSTKKVDLKPLITSTYPLTQANEAFEAQHARRDIKIVIYNQM
ncbi:putative sorbitol dehydrogenase [Colletotrichum gloeosporioides]|uniref:D-xylulose reductase n=1 Tax=Colletotrichum gloeosporioides TaxID=474922 RepID=A0A8H4FE02_COLGL|nr:putative sorbitol dehydrogenase [Colletotrichum gloeosporioides]KAF3797539.1 putative sorbitol dehydrogenase [Colletotrichum gloeosporioides]